jgi:hypothetical protein
MKKRKYTEIHLTPSPRLPYKNSATEGKGGVNCFKAHKRIQGKNVYSDK